MKAVPVTRGWHARGNGAVAVPPGSGRRGGLRQLGALELPVLYVTPVDGAAQRRALVEPAAPGRAQRGGGGGHVRRVPLDDVVREPPRGAPGRPAPAAR